MEPEELLEIINHGEDGKHQFKGNVINVNSLAAEMVAFSNSEGGQIIIGVTDDYEIAGLSKYDIRRINGIISYAASQSVRPPFSPKTENIAFDSGIVIVVTIFPGISKPYMVNSGAIWVKSGSDKRRVTSREELQRMFQAAGLIHADEIPAQGFSINDFDLSYFKQFYNKQYGESFDSQELALPVVLTNMNLMQDETFNLAGALLFGKDPQIRLPAFGVKCVCYPGNEIHSSEYIDSEDVSGNIEQLFKKSLSFIMRNISRQQKGQNVNTLGELEIPKIVLEELLVNALIHRDYFITAPIRIFVFDERIELISPGHLPNNLTLQSIKSGVSNIRNPILASYATKTLPYRGLGNGIRRALAEYPDINFIDDKDGNQFKAIINRKK